MGAAVHAVAEVFTEVIAREEGLAGIALEAVDEAFHAWLDRLVIVGLAHAVAAAMVQRVLLELEVVQRAELDVTVGSHGCGFGAPSLVLLKRWLTGWGVSSIDLRGRFVCLMSPSQRTVDDGATRRCSATLAGPRGVASAVAHDGADAAGEAAGAVVATIRVGRATDRNEET